MHKIRQYRVKPNNAKFLLIYLASYANADGRNIYPGWQTTLDETQLAKATVTAAINALLADGILIQESGSNNHSAAVYRIDLTKLDTKSVVLNPGSTKDSLPDFVVLDSSSTNEDLLDVVVLDSGSTNENFPDVVVLDSGSTTPDQERLVLPGVSRDEAVVVLTDEKKRYSNAREESEERELNTHKEGVCEELGLGEDTGQANPTHPTPVAPISFPHRNQPPRSAAEIWALGELNTLLGEPHEMPVDGLPAAQAYSQDDIALVLRFLALDKDSPFRDSRGQTVGHYWRIATPKSVFGVELFKTRLAQAKGRFKNDVPTAVKMACRPGSHEFDDRRVDMAGTLHGCCLNCKEWHPIGNAQGVA